MYMFYFCNTAMIIVFAFQTFYVAGGHNQYNISEYSRLQCVQPCVSLARAAQVTIYA